MIIIVTMMMVTTASVTTLIVTHLIAGSVTGNHDWLTMMILINDDSLVTNHGHYSR